MIVAFACLSFLEAILSAAFLAPHSGPFLVNVAGTSVSTNQLVVLGHQEVIIILVLLLLTKEKDLQMAADDLVTKAMQRQMAKQQQWGKRERGQEDEDLFEDRSRVAMY